MYRVETVETVMTTCAGSRLIREYEWIRPRTFAILILSIQTEPTGCRRLTVVSL